MRTLATAVGILLLPSVVMAGSGVLALPGAEAPLIEVQRGGGRSTQTGPSSSTRREPSAEQRLAHELARHGLGMIGPPPLPDLPPLPPSRSRRNEEALRAMAGSVPQRFPGPEASQFLRAEAETAGLERDRLRADTARPGWSILTIAGREYPVDLGLLATWHAALRDPRPPPAFLLVRLAPPFPGGPPGYLLLTGDGFTRSYKRPGRGDAHP
jgi:hypothetical protein